MGPTNDETVTSCTCTHTHTDANKEIESSTFNSSGVLQVAVANEDTRDNAANPARCSKTSCYTPWLTYEQGCINLRDGGCRDEGEEG